MTDTDKYDYDYENIQEWVVSGNTVLSVAPPENRIVATNLTIQDAQLIADAPLLLAEVKRLREENDELHAQRVQISWIQEARGGQSKAFELLAEVERLRGLLDEIDDVVYYNDKKAGLVLPVEKPNLELLRDIMMSYTDEAYQIRGDEGEVIE